MANLEEQFNEQILKGTVPVNDQNLQQALIETAVLDDLNDVNISSPTDGQILGYNSGTNSWQNTNSVIGDNTITNAKLAQVATATVKGRATVGTGNVEDLVIDADLSSVSANDDTIPSAKAVKAYVDALKLVIYPVGAIYTSVVNTNPSTFIGGTWSAFGSGRTLVGVDTGQTEFDLVEETGGAKTHTLTSGEMPSHTHTQDSHNHTQNSHNHTQDSHNHTQNSHNHTQNAHNHSISDPSHQHGQYTTANANSGGGVPRADYDGDVGNYTAYTQGVNTMASNTGISINNATATNQATTATNQATTATNQATTATNQATTATNQNTGGGAAHNNLQPYITVYFWKRTA